MQSLPLRFKLPLLITTLLCVVVVSLGWFGNREVERVLLEAMGARLSQVTQKLVVGLEESARRLPTETRRFASDTTFTRALSVGDSASRAVAERTMIRLRTGTLFAMDLSDRNRQSVLYVGAKFRVSPTDSVTPERVAAGASVDTGMVGPLVKTDSGVMYRVTIPVVSATNDTLGYYTQYRTLGSGQGVALINDLIGTGATLMFGNVSGNLWTELNRVVSGPTVPVVTDSLMEYTGDQGVEQLAVANRIRGTPWMAMVQVPRANALAPARRFLVGMLSVAIVVVLVGCGAALIFTRQLTRPLTDVSSAARDLASGDYSRRVPNARSDEIGALAGAFNQMAVKVEASNAALKFNAEALRMANADLRQSEQRYRQLVELMPDAILVHRGDEVTYANGAAVTLFGASSTNALLEHKLSELVPESNGASGRTNGVAATANPRLRQRRANTLSGGAITAEAVDIAFADDASKSQLMIIRDVSERERLEERFRQAQKMEAVGQLAGGVAHDFNNLLTVITTYCAILLADMHAETQLRADVQEISNAADRASILTRQLLAFSRQQVLETRVVSMNTVIAEMEKMLRRVIPENIRLETRLDSSIGNICADPGQLEQVLMNLAVNARDAMPSGGELKLATSVIDILESDGPMHSGATPGTYVLLTVSDTGCGMTAEQQERIFDPFYTTKPVGQGTGLGLSTVYGIVKQSGGFVGVYSEPDHGSVFRIYLPQVDAAETAKERPSGLAASSRGNETILLVEDELIVRTAARRILEAAGYTVLEVGNANDALDLAVQRRGPIDLLLTDMVMPGLSGRDLSAQFRKLRPQAPTVYMSGYTEDTFLRQSASEPELVFVQKPFTPQSLTQKVRKALEASASSMTAG